jgi:hypothetical protein
MDIPPAIPSLGEQTEAQRSKEDKLTAMTKLGLLTDTQRIQFFELNKEKKLLPIFVRANMISNFQFIILG